MGVSSLRLEPRYGGVFSCLPSMLGGLAGNRHERLGESVGRGIGRAQGSRSPAGAGAPPHNTGINHIHRAGNGFSGPSPHGSVGASAYRVWVGEMAVVLIVEDEEQVRVLAEAIVRELGHETLTAGTAEQALAVVAERSDVDLLFTDIGLQQDTEAGLQLAREVTARRPALPVLYTTGQGVTDGMRAMFAEPFGFVPKPYTPEDLRTALSNLLSRGSAASGRVNGTGSADPSGRRQAGVAG
jgi:two-component system, response regulator PdtaR